MTDPMIARPASASVNGGNVTFDLPLQNVTLAAGSTIDVSSGGAILANGKTQGGKGGNVTIKAGDVQQNAGTVGDGTLVLDSTIRAYGVNGGGTLTVSSPGNILIGDSAELAGGVLAGTPAPVAVKLKQAFTIPAGQPLPATLTLNFTSLVYDVPIPADVAISAVAPAPTGADWTVPQGMDGLQSRDGNGQPQYWSAGSVIPAGTVITGWSGTGHIPAGAVIPSSVFPSGIPVNSYTVSYAAGSVQSTPMTYPVGAVIPAGTVLSQTVEIVPPAPALAPSFFTAGFSNYDINGGQGVLVANGTVLAPTMPVYQFTTTSYAAPSGSDPASALSVWLPPLFIENPLSGSLTQRGGASLTLRSQITSGNGTIASGGSIVVGDNASIAVDPGQSITLNGFGQITVLGDLIAHGGSITLANIADGTQVDAARNFDVQGNGRGISIWVDANARLDVSGLAYQATDLAGHRYGIATDGGAIAINGGGAFVLIRPGAELNADGTQTVIDLAAGTAAAQPLTLATNGGSITLSSNSGLYLDGDMHAAAGGANASGGSLSISLITPTFLTNAFPNGVLPAAALTPSTMVVQQAYQSSSLPSDIAPGTDAWFLKFGQATVSADRVKAGGFDSLTLSSGDYMQFSGDVSLSLGRSLTLSATAFTSGALSTAPALSTGHVDLSAPYILLNGPVITVKDGQSRALAGNPGPGGANTEATFEAHAAQIDIQGLVQFATALGVYDNTTFQTIYSYAPGFLTTTLVSDGDIRFLSSAAAQGTVLKSDWNLDLEAAQIYPATKVVATVIVGQRANDPAVALGPDSNVTLTIGRTTDTIPDAPLSVFGTLALSAPIVEQGGIVRAPFGNIILEFQLRLQ